MLQAVQVRSRSFSPRPLPSRGPGSGRSVLGLVDLGDLAANVVLPPLSADEETLLGRKGWIGKVSKGPTSVLKDHLSQPLEVLSKAVQVAQGGYLGGEFGAKADKVQSDLLACSRATEVLIQRRKALEEKISKGGSGLDPVRMELSGVKNALTQRSQDAVLLRIDLERYRVASLLKVYSIAKGQLADQLAVSDPATSALNRKLSVEAEASYQVYLGTTPEKIAKASQNKQGLGDLASLDAWYSLPDWADPTEWDWAGLVDSLWSGVKWGWDKASNNKVLISAVLSAAGPVLTYVGAGLCATGVGCAVGGLLVAAAPFVASAAAAYATAAAALAAAEKAKAAADKAMTYVDKANNVVNGSSSGVVGWTNPSVNAWAPFRRIAPDKHDREKGMTSTELKLYSAAQDAQVVIQRAADVGKIGMDGPIPPTSSTVLAAAKKALAAAKMAGAQMDAKGITAENSFDYKAGLRVQAKTSTPSPGSSGALPGSDSWSPLQIGLTVGGVLASGLVLYKFWPSRLTASRS